MTARRRLLIVAQPLVGGVPRHVLDLVGALDRALYEIVVACPRESETADGLRTDRSVEVVHLDLRRQPSPFDATAVAKLAPLLRSAQIVHAHSAKAGFLTRLAAAGLGRTNACVFSPHGWSFWAAAGTTGKLYLGLERAAAHWCRTIVAVSAAERDAGLRAGVGTPGKYRVVPNGIDLCRFDLDPRPVDGRILVLGRLDSPKRLDLALEAFARVGEEFPRAELHFAGDGPGTEPSRRLAQMLGVEERIRWLGYAADVGRLLAEAHCLLLASDYEGCPLSILEAMAAGVPVVATSVGGVPELIEDGRTGILVEPGRADRLAEALGTILREPQRALSMGQAGREVARRRYSRERMARELADIYDEIAETGRSV